MNKEKRSLEQECVRKKDRGNIYLSPDGSVLGVHLWRNEISGWLSGRGRLCCPAAYTPTQHPLPRLSLALSGLIQPAVHLICWTIRCVCAQFCVRVCVYVCVRAHRWKAKPYYPGTCPTPPLHQMTRAVSSTRLSHTISLLHPSWDLIESPTKSSIHQTDTLANTLTWSFHFQSRHKQDWGWVYAHVKWKSSIAVVFVHMNTDALACIFNEIQAGIYANLDLISNSIKN